MKRTIYVLLTLCPILWTGCKEEGRIDFVENASPAPQPVAIVRVTNTQGGAVVKYQVPDDENLLGVKVVYTRNGEICESKASKYVDTLSIQGYGTTDSQSFELYSVGIGGKLSAPVSGTFTPLTPAVRTVKFDVEETFGGVLVAIDENITKADLAVVLMADTGRSGKWEDIHTFYTRAEIIKLSRRGLDPKMMDFGVYLRDRWNNKSDTIWKTLTPVEEIKIPKANFRNAALPTDYFVTAENNTGYRLENMWNGEEVANGNFFASGHSGPMPQWFTIDLGGKYSISRIQKWPRANYEIYSGTAPRIFQVWGSTAPNPSGEWDESWTLLGEFEQFKPSGYGEGMEVGPITDEDRDYFYNRTEFVLAPADNIIDPYIPVTHLRFKVLSTFATYGTETTMGQIIIAELTFWGQIKD
jgi:hypothetical protein